MRFAIQLLNEVYLLPSFINIHPRGRIPIVLYGKMQLFFNSNTNVFQGIFLYANISLVPQNNSYKVIVKASKSPSVIFIPEFSVQIVAPDLCSSSNNGVSKFTDLSRSSLDKFVAARLETFVWKLLWSTWTFGLLKNGSCALLDCVDVDGAERQELVNMDMFVLAISPSSTFSLRHGRLVNLIVFCQVRRQEHDMIGTSEIARSC